MRKPTNGLLIFYLLDSHGIDGGEHIEPGPPFTSFAVSFPQIKGDKGVDYTVNVYLEGTWPMNDNKSSRSDTSSIDMEGRRRTRR